MGTKKEVQKRLAENESSTGDQTMSTQIEKGTLVLHCDVCMVFVHANKRNFLRHLKTEKHLTH